MNCENPFKMHPELHMSNKKMDTYNDDDTPESQTYIGIGAALMILIFYVVFRS